MPVVLQTAYGCPGGPSINQCLIDECSVIRVDANSEAAELDFTIPYAHEAGYIREIKRLYNSPGFDVLLPCSSAELEKLSKNRDKLPFKTVVNGPVAIERCLDKPLTYSHFLEYAPDSYEVSSKKAFEEACRCFGYPELPVFTKPIVGNGSRGAFCIKGAWDADQIVFDKGWNKTTLKGFLETFTLDFPEMLVMEYLPGDEYSVDVLCREGETLCAIPRLRVKTTGGIATDTVTVDNSEAVEIAKAIVEKLKLSYAVNIQLKQDQHNKLKLLEVNPRVAGGMCITARAGCNMPLLAVKMALGEEIPDRFEVKTGVRMRRVWKEIYS